MVIVDDLVQTGGTLFECGNALKAQGALRIFAFVPHAVFPQGAWKKFLRNTDPPGAYSIFETFWVTNSVATTTAQLPTDDAFEVLSMMPQVIQDLEGH